MFPAKGSSYGKCESDSDSLRQLLLSQFQKPSGKRSPSSEPLENPRRSRDGVIPSSMPPRALPTRMSNENRGLVPLTPREPVYTEVFESRTPTPSENQPPVSRRSGRQRTGPANYYQVKIFDDMDREGEEDESEVTTSVLTQAPQGPRSQASPPRPEADNNAAKTEKPWTQLRTNVIYSSRDMHVLRSIYNSLDKFTGLHRAFYSRQLHPAEYISKSKAENSAVVHVDFGEDEMEAVIGQLSYFGCSADSEVSLTDQIIGILSMHKDIKALVDGLLLFNGLIRRLPQNPADQGEWVLEIMRSNSDTKEICDIKTITDRLTGLRNKIKFKSVSSGSVADDENSLIATLKHAIVLHRRHASDIEAFLADARNGHLSTLPCITWVVEAKKEDGQIYNRKAQKCNTLDKLLRGRELGSRFNHRTQSRFASDLKPSKYWKGASNDVIVLAWSPVGTRFAAGATAQCDEHNMAYNRNNNLLLGDLAANSVKELPDHQICRPWRPMANQNFTNDPLFMSVTAVQWSGDVLATSSYDNTVKLWDVKSHENAHCFKTLRHDSKVQVMARSNFNQNALATGASSVALWNIKEEQCIPLEFHQRFSKKKDMELLPTSLAWGTINATKNILLAGMSEKGDGVLQNGCLAIWHMNETSATPLHITPNSQNVFDIKWHPSMPYFATGSTPAYSRASSAKSVVRIYEPLGAKMAIMELDCPAIDINDVTFCPRNPNYVTASCTDGATYVWDCRKPDDFLLRLKHDGPINQIDENITREQADVGVRTALWGDSADQFYSGASDGVLKKWDILRSQDDAHVQDVIHLPEEIMCGAFSGDKTNLLIGDAAGGIHVLSSGPFHTDEDLRMKYEQATEPVQHKEESGVEDANNLLRYGELVRHPVYGVGQGPHYKGPFAGWARSEGTPKDLLAQTPLKEEYMILQLDGPPLNDRGLDKQTQKDIAAQIQLAEIRNQKRHQHKRKRHHSSKSPSHKGSKKSDSSRTKRHLSLCSEDEANGIPRRHSRNGKSKRRSLKRILSGGQVITNIEPGIIDLTLESDTEHRANIPIRKETNAAAEEWEETDEEDFWWPASGTINPNIQDRNA